MQPDTCVDNLSYPCCLKVYGNDRTTVLNHTDPQPRIMKERAALLF